MNFNHHIDAGFAGDFPPIKRRIFHGLIGMAALSSIQGCSTQAAKTISASPMNIPSYEPYLAEILAQERARPKTGRRTNISLTPQLHQIDLGGPIVTTPSYGATVPGNVLRAQVGDVISATIRNELPFPTNVHWHGLTIRNDADLAPAMNQPLVNHKEFQTEFTVTESGTYWIHPHYYMDSDYGLYAPLIIDDPHEPQAYDAEWIIVIDDWTQGIGPRPPQIFQGLLQNGSFDACDIYDAQQAKGVRTPGLMREDIPALAEHSPRKMGSPGDMLNMPGMSSGKSTPAQSGIPSIPVPKQRFHSMTSQVDRHSLRGDVGDVHYPYYLINGRIPAAPSVFKAKPGQRIRLRIINASADTAYTIALSGHNMAVTHTDGMPITPEKVDAVIIGMGERYDAIITAEDGIFPLVARAEGKNDIARALLITGAGQVPEMAFRPAELEGKKFFATQFQGVHTTQDYAHSQIATQCNFNLGGGMHPYRWSINDMFWPEFRSSLVKENTFAQINFINKTMMWHPMHLHGHRMLLAGRNHTYINKDTILIAPMTRVSVIIKADNPGAWLVHCHNGYHMDAGMTSRLDYAR